jgi:hypothetical protein
MPALPGLRRVCLGGYPAAQGFAQGNVWPDLDEKVKRSMPEGVHATRLPLVLVPLRYEGADARYVAAGPQHPVELEARWTLLPDARTNNDPALHGAVERSLSVREVRQGKSRPPAGNGRDDRLKVMIACDAPPADLVYRATLRRHHGRSLSFGWENVLFARGVPGQTAVVEFSAGAGPAEAVEPFDLVLTPEPDSAPLDVAEIAGGEVVIKDVRVRPAAAREEPRE